MGDETWTRRRLAETVLRVLGPLALLRELSARGALAAPMKFAARDLLSRVDEASGALAARRLRPAEWQARVEELGARADIGDLCRAVDLERLSRTVPPAGDWARGTHVRLGPYRFGTQVFGFARGTAITPHGHRNMASMHLVIGGELRCRQYDRLRDETDHLILRPVLDRACRAGEATSISSEQRNVHWFVATSDSAFTFDVVVDNLDPSMGRPYFIDLVDPAGAEKLADGTLRARRIGWDESLRLYATKA
jgi:hypothetical protein